MSRTVAQSLDSIPLRNVKAELRRVQELKQNAHEVQKLKGDKKALNPDAGEVLDIARGDARLEAKEMAADMGVSHSLVCRGLESKDGLSFHLLWELGDDFWAALIVAIARKRKLATVRTVIEVQDERRRA